LSGDTLFAAGCGRLFEGTPEQMFASLLRLLSAKCKLTADFPFMVYILFFEQIDRRSTCC